jgi:3-hydroxyisobutyrate dehydrogenase-like beta-hydroxyacid dehydrogenase
LGRVGFVGLGNMGSALAANLVGAGVEVLAHDVAGPERNPAGATFAEDLAEVASADVVVLSLPDGTVCDTVVRALAGAPGSAVRYVVDTSTVGPEASRALDALLAEAGIGYVDAPVSGGAAGARARTLTLMFAGAPEICDAVMGVLQGLTDRLCRVGDRAGMAQAVKLANNFLSATALAATSEAIAFGTAAGIDMATMLEVINASSGRSAASEDKFVNHVLPGTYASGFANTLMAKDLGLYRSAVAAQGSPATVCEVTVDVWRAFAEDEPGVDFTRIYPYTNGS